MSGPLNDLVGDILADQLRNGPTTCRAVAATAIATIERSGGPEKWGFGRAWIYEAMKSDIIAQTKARMKSGLYSDDPGILRNYPPSLADQLRKLPYAIAISEGCDAAWVSSLNATIDDWTANANLKAKKATETMKQADQSMDIAVFLRKHGLTCLADSLPFAE
jgi:hypothetical protein